MPTLVPIVTSVFVLALALILVLTYGLYRFALYSPREGQNDDHHLPLNERTRSLGPRMEEMVCAMEALPYERVSITSQDGLRLTGRYLHQKEGAPLHICFHGYRGTPFRDFSGGARSYLSFGHNVLLVEQRAHLSSEGHTITLGVMERLDVLSWVDYAGQRFGSEVPIILTGISMGAATVLMASSLPLPPQVCGIIADCPYTTPKAILQKVGARLGFHPALSYPLLALGARLFGHFSLSGVSATESVSQTDLPILLIHGEADSFVPFSMSEEIAAANPEMVTFCPFPGAEHGLSFLYDQERYEREVRSFLERVLPGGV